VPGVENVKYPLTMHFGPNEVLLNLEVEFRSDIPATEITAAVERLEKTIRDQHPEVCRIFIEAHSLAA
jgi:divalent metal cation (Fe/Co/Zn/Cd) transporter